MLCYLSEIEIRPRDGKTPFLICKWIGIDGDAQASKFITDPKTGKKRINLAAAKARQITLNKSIFPLTKEDMLEWIKGMEYQVLRKPDADGNIEEKKFDTILQDCTQINLVYKQVPLSELDCEYKAISYYTTAGVLKTQNFITVIGFADEDDNWAESQSPIEMAQSNLNTNLTNGTYFEADEASKASEEEKKSAEEKKSTKNDKSDVDFDF